MNLPNLKLSKKSTTLLITLGVIGIVYAFYFFVYVDNHEKAYNQKAYRSLEQIGKNLQEKLKVYVKMCKASDTLKKKLINKGFKYHVKNESTKNFNCQEKYLKNIYYESCKNKINTNDSLLYHSLEDFVKPVLNKKDQIEEFIIVRKNSVISFQTFNNKVRIKEIDALSYNRINKSESKTTNIEVQGINYRMFTHNFEFDKEESWLLIGFVKNSEYVKQTRSLNLWLIINLFLVVFLLIVSLPLLKLSLMNPIERLNKSNVFYSGLSIVIGTPLLIMFFLIFSSYFYYEIKNIDNKLDKLSKNILKNFKNEIIDFRNKLADFNEIKINNCKANDTLDFDTENFTLKKLDADSIKLKKIEKNFNEVFWMDKYGNQTVVIREDTTSVNKNGNTFYNLEKRNGSKVVLKDRAYFSNAIKKKLWNYPETKDSLFIQSIVSWSTGQPEIAISAESKDTMNPVIAITAKLKSVMDAILPMGYGFCFINADGEVKLHSDSTKNLQENFLEETNQNSDLVSAIYARVEKFTTVDYLHKKRRVFIKPINETPYYIIVYYDLDLSKAMSSEIWSVSLIIFLFSFLIVGLIVLLIYFNKLSSSRLLIKKFFFDWMSPRKELLTKYKSMIVINLLSIVLLIIFIQISKQEPFWILIELIFVPIFSLIYNYLGLTWKIQKKPESSKSNSTFWYSVNKNYTLKLNSVFGKSIKKIYPLYLTTWLLQSAIVPIILIYITYYNIESEIWAKHSLVDLIEKIVAKDIDVEKIPLDSLIIYKNFADITLSNRDSLIKLGKTDSYKNEIYSYPIMNKLLYYLRPGYEKSIIKNRGLVSANYKISCNDSSQIEFYKNDNSLILKYRKLNGKDIYLSHKLNPFNLLSFSNKYLFLHLSILFFIFFILYKIITYSIIKIYGLHYSNYKKNDVNFGEQIKEAKKKINMILIGLPGASKLTRIYKKKSISKHDIPIIDCRSCNYAEIIKKLKDASKNDIIQINNDFQLIIKKDEEIILDNFEYNNNNHEMNCLKLKLLEELQKNQLRIIIVSELHPSETIDYHYRNIIDKSINISDNIKQKYETSKESWRQILSGFMLIYLPLHKSNFSVDRNNLYSIEMQHGSYLRNMFAIIKKNSSKEKDETVILDIQQRANSCYFGLWNALTRREKFAVYDLADDEFINTGNTSVINTLLKKGIFKFDTKLKLMNKSFANFVLTIVKDGEVVEMDREVRKKGKWANIKLVIILVLIALVSLIGFGQPDFFSNINAISIVLVGVASVIPSVSRVFTLTRKIK